MAQIRISGMCALWPWHLRFSRSWHTVELWTILVWNIIQIQHCREELWLGHRFWVCVHCDPDLGDMTLGQGHDTPLCHVQQLCEILSRFNMAVRSYGPDTDFGYLCTVTLTFEVWLRAKVMTHPWVMDNNCVKYYLDQTWPWEVMTRTQILGMCALWPWPWVMTHPVMYNNCVKYLKLDPTWHGGVMAWTQNLGMCGLWPWPWRYDLGSRSWHTLGSCTTIVWNIN